MLSLYTFFHLNLAFSSIEEEDRPDVIRKCYWPLLQLAAKYDLPLGIEVSGYTLETINTLDPYWIDELRDLCGRGIVELIGSGYVQLIGPLVPPEVNAANLRIGNQVYGRILGLRPEIALVNEQAYSTGLIGHYRDAGYRAIVMEWNNPAHFHPDWQAEWRYLPQVAIGQHGEEIPVIWNKSVAFQKFQRYAHGEMEPEEYFNYLEQHLGHAERAFPLYGNDVEIFDFRPGRFHTEAEMQGEGEWDRIKKLFERLTEDNRFRCIPVSTVLDLMNQPDAGNRLTLESPEQPVPVKKQEKYNLTRWAVTGRDNLRINTECWRLYRRLLKEKDARDSEWKELCYLWGSDFRTHITEKRWVKFNERLESMLKRHSTMEISKKKEHVQWNLPQASPFRVDRRKHLLEIQTPCLKLRLNMRRGIAIDGAYSSLDSNQPLLCSLPHGHFDDITLAADFYTGHLVFEIPGRPKITDLNPLEPQVGVDAQNLVVEGVVNTPLGNVRKRVIIPPNLPEFTILYDLGWKTMPLGALRLGHITLNPDAFDSKSLFYRTHNGGFKPETFLVGDRPINHLTPVMPLVSASQGLGVTEGIVEIGDNNRVVRVEIDRSEAALTGHIVYHPSGSSYLFRLVFSASEVDDTCQYSTIRNMFPNHPISIRVDLSPSGC